jgi:(3S)-malyl-CoA thioesterase
MERIMARPVRPYRSVLYIPASKARALEKARSLPADAIIFDLEDAVAVEEKANARALLMETLREGGYAPRAQIVRLNPVESDWGEADLAALLEIGPEALLLPKVERPEQVEAVAARLDAHPACADTRIWAMMETPRCPFAAPGIARAPRMAGFVMGTNDLAKDLGTRFRPDRLPLQWALQTCLAAARAEGIACIDGVYNAFRDIEGLRAECEQGRDLGMDGKTVVHPAQIEVANEIFAPTEEEIALARRQIDAFEEARARGEGVAVVDGQIVENLHVDTARATLAQVEAIRSMSGREAA